VLASGQSDNGHPIWGFYQDATALYWGRTLNNQIVRVAKQRAHDLDHRSPARHVLQVLLCPDAQRCLRLQQNPPIISH
jgi:hypothetical protein